jgi:SAM-dependent methyltransferase
MAETQFDEWIAQRNHLLWPELFEPSVVQPAVEVLADPAGTGSALEFGIGTGHIAIPLSQRGVRVQGVELSAAMVTQLRAQHDTANIDVTIGDFATTKVDRSFRLVYLPRNTITNLITQDEQVQAFRNAAAHLEPGGLFVIENYVPELRRISPGETIHVFVATPPHLGFEDYDTTNRLRCPITTG